MLAAALVTIVGAPSFAGTAHPPAVFGYHVTWSTGTLFLFGIMVGAVGSTLFKAEQRVSADRHQLVDRVPGQIAVHDRRHHQLVQVDGTAVVVEKRDVGGIATGGDAH